MNSIKKRLVVAFLIFIILVIFGTIGFYLIGNFYLPRYYPDFQPWSFLNCFYMMLITVTTTGYGEILDKMDVPFVRFYTSTMLFMGIVVYVNIVSSMTTFFVEGAFSKITQRRRMQKKINTLKNHIIVCGLGEEGYHIIKELLTTNWPLVAIDHNEESIKAKEPEFKKLGNFLYIVGDALEEKTLKAACIEKAHGLLSALPEDKDNLFVTITARQINKDLRIVSKAVDLRTSKKMKIAGADTVVSTNYIGGLRMVSEMIRPQVVEFLDIMLRGKKENLRIEEIRIPKNSDYCNKTIAQSKISKAGKVLIIAVKDLDNNYVYGPGPDFILKGNMILVIMGVPDEISILRENISFA
ncbi:MAG: potassium channel family protein [Myxococcota bacterium]